MNQSSTTLAPVANSSSSSSLKWSDLSLGQLVALNCLLSTELCCALLCLPISAVNFCVILHTRVLHRNLRFLLQCQCLCVVLYSFGRIVELVRKFVAPTAPMLFGLFSIRILTILFGDWLGLMLLIERVMATVTVRSYEYNNHAAFRVCSLLCTLALTLVCYATGIDRGSTNMVSRKAHPEIYGGLAVGVVCTLIWLALHRYNLRAYARNAYKRNSVHDLSERYQLSENIRTFRQLLPTTILHFFNTYLTIGSSLLMSSDLITDKWMATLCATIIFVLFSASNLIMQITVIIFHPILNRKAHRMVRALRLIVIRPLLFCCCFSRPTTTTPVQNLHAARQPTATAQLQLQNRVHSETSAVPERPKDIYGADLVREAQMQEHFQMLAQWWQVDNSKSAGNNMEGTPAGGKKKIG